MREKQIFFDLLKVNEPVFIEDIIRMYPSCSRQWIDHELSVLKASGEIKRYATGIYYRPSENRSGVFELDDSKVIRGKYIERGDSVFGYVSGDTLLKALGLINREPDVMTIVTNKEKSRGRNVMIGGKRIRLTKPLTEITKDNVAVLRFLEAVRIVDIKERDQIVLSRLEKYIIKYRVTFSAVHQYCIHYPDSVSKKILGTSLIQALISREKYGWYNNE